MVHDAGGDGDHLVGKGREAGAGDDPGAPFLVARLELLEAIHVAVKFDDRAADGVEQQRADNAAFFAAIANAERRALHSSFDQHVVADEEAGYITIDEGDYGALPMRLIDRGSEAET